MSAVSAVHNSPSGNSAQPQKNYSISLAILTLLFFIWGFIVSLNDVLIPKLMNVFTLLHWQAMLIQSAYFGAYFVVSLLYFILSVTKEDPIMKLGYKNGIIIGLLICAVGAVLFFPAAVYKSYGFFLVALFVLASGTTILQIAANPYVTILGSPDTASARLNLTQALNSLGTTIAPILGGYLIFGHLHLVSANANADSVKMPYLYLAGILLLIALVMKLAKLPPIVKDDVNIHSAGALKHRHLVLGVICIFAYVGGEVTIGSSIINFLKLPSIGGFPEEIAKNYLAFFWGGAMIGRFLGAIALGSFKEDLYKYGMMLVVSVAVFVVVWSAFSLNLGIIMFGLVLLNALVFRLASFDPSRTLSFFAVAVLILLIMTITTTGSIALWSVVAIGFFNSIMFPTIFALSVKGLGNYTSQGASLLVMACVGGAVVPPLQGYVADVTHNLQFSFITPIFCYLYVLYYGIAGYKMKDESVLAQA